MVSDERWRAICLAFDEAVDRDASSRAAYLDRLRADDPDLHSAVLKLIAHDAVADRVVGGLEDLAALPLPGDVLALVGKQVAHFRIIAPIAVGGMGVVYRAEHTLLGRTVALKLPLQTQPGDPSTRNRFLREGRAAGALEHPNVCRVYEVGESDEGQLYIAMALYEGETVRQRLDRVTRLPVDEAIAIAQQVARGLSAAHRAGVIHRDLKPANIMLELDGNVRILDFGLARTFDATQSQVASTMGTVAYMAPERINGSDADARADLWSLGVMLYEMLVGRRPFVGEHPLAVANAILNHEPSPPRRVRGEVPWRVDALVQQLLRKNANERPASAPAVDEELAAIASGQTASLGRRLRVTLARAWHRTELMAMLGVGAGLTALGAWKVLTTSPRTAAGAGIATAARRGTHDAQAWEFFTRAQLYATRSSTYDDQSLARGLYERAIARDSGFALAHARLAVALVRIAESGREPDRPNLRSAKTEADVASRLQKDIPDANLALGLYFNSSGDERSALQYFERAAQGMPNSAEPTMAMALIHRAAGRWTETKRQLQRAAAAEPSNVQLMDLIAFSLQRMREYQDALRLRDRVRLLEPDNYDNLLVRGYLFTRWTGTTDTLKAALAQLPAGWNPNGDATIARLIVARLEHRPAEALTVLRQSGIVVARDPFIHRPRALLEGQLWADLGDTARARASFAAAIPVLEDSLAAATNPPHDYRIRVALGEAYAGAGRRNLALTFARKLVTDAAGMGDYVVASVALGGAAEIYTRAGVHGEAIALLDRLLDRAAGREASVAILRADPTWDPLRNDPRFTRMLARPRARLQ